MWSWILKNSFLLAAILTCTLSSVDAAPERDGNGQFQEQVEKAQGHYRAGEYQQAAELLRSAYQLRSQPNLLLNLGHVSMRLGRADEALSFYQHYLSERPDLPKEERVNVDRYIRNARELLAVKSRTEATDTPAPDSAPAAPQVVLAQTQSGTGTTTSTTAAEAVNPSLVGATQTLKERAVTPAPKWRRALLWSAGVGSVALVSLGVILGTRPWDRVPSDLPIDTVHP